MIDLRSDTLTQPGKAMRKAMAGAKVGDDVFGEDPTVRELEERAAAFLGQKTALFVPSGTMANQLAIKSQCLPGDEVIVEEASHIYNFENAGMAGISGVQARPIRTPRGVYDVEGLESQLRDPTNVHHTRTRIICVENTHNRHGGSVYPLKDLTQLIRFAKRHSLLTHLDGARLANASVCLGIPAKKIAGLFDTATLCLSKGLGAPVGSVVAGSKQFITAARTQRKMLGGGMRQAGILAAAGIYALDHHVERLAEDHENARLFASELSGLDALHIPHEVQSNIVYLQFVKAIAKRVMNELFRQGLKLSIVDPHTLRAVFHLDISRKEAKKASQTIKTGITKVK